MEVFKGRKRATIILAAVILPLSLLTAFKLTGIILEPQQPETVLVNSVKWNMTRPIGVIHDVEIDEDIMNSYRNEALIELKIHIHDYIVNWGRYGYNDVTTFRISATANISGGFIYSVAIKLSRTDVYSYLNMLFDFDMIELENLSLKRIEDATSKREGYVFAVSVNQPAHCFLKVEAEWVFFDPNDGQSHEIVLTLEVTYFNGAVYKKVVTPIQLGVYA